MDRRALFFLVAVAVCGALIAPTPETLRWFPIVLGALYAVLALASALDNSSRHRDKGPRS